VSINLPRSIADYVEANARLDVDGMLAAFAADAVVKDEAREHHGHAEIRPWIQSATIAARAIFTPKSWREDDGAVIVEGTTVGDFPESPLPFAFRFKLSDRAISTLEIV
jgi:hypothetical protein